MIISEKLSKKISSDLTGRGIIKKEYLDSYAYCLEFLFDMVLFNASLIIIGAILHHTVPALIFIITMTPIKMVAGGAHGGSRLSCEIISYSIFAAVMLISSIIIINHIICFAISVSIALGIMILSPVDTSGRKRVHEHRKQLRILCVIFCSLIILLEYIFIINDYPIGSTVILLCLITIFVNQILGRIIIRLQNSDKT
ncbi:MAG: accessory gene regulator B family protein [Candidatus Weimeria sp.]